MHAKCDSLLLLCCLLDFFSPEQLLYCIRYTVVWSGHIQCTIIPPLVSTLFQNFQLNESIFQSNVSFTTEDDEVKFVEMDSVNKTADLLQVDKEELKRTLCERVIAARGEIMQKTHTLAEAEYGKDALAKVLSRLFYAALIITKTDVFFFSFFYFHFIVNEKTVIERCNILAGHL